MVLLYKAGQYAIRRKANELFLIYPQSIMDHFDSEKKLEDHHITFKITDEFSSEQIKVRILKAPIIHPHFPRINTSNKLSVEFNEASERLTQFINNQLDIVSAICENK